MGIRTSNYIFMLNLRRTLALSLISILGHMYATATLTVYKQKDKYGYSDENGVVVIEAKYTQAYPFENGMAKVCKGKKWGYIDETGKEIIKIQYENIEPFNDGIARVKKGKKYGYIREDGTVYIKPDYEFIGTFNDGGYVWVAKGKTLSLATKGLYKNDQLIVEPKYTSLGFYVKTDSADYTDGRPITFANGAPENYEIKQNFCKLSCPEEPYIWRCPNSFSTVICDLDGNVLIKQQKSAIGMPIDGYSITRQYKRIGNKQYYTFNYISADGNKNKKLLKKDITQLVDPNNIYESCQPFCNGYALCGTESSASIIDTNGQTISNTYTHLTPVKGQGYISIYGDSYGLVAINGHEIVAPTYKKILLPTGTSSFDILPAQDVNSGLFGFIDFKGSVVTPFKFENAAAYINNRGYVKDNGYWGIIDNTGKYIVKNRWDGILFEKFAGTDHIWVKSPSSGKWQCLQVSTDKICFEAEFDEAGAFDTKGRALISQGKLIGAVDTKGNMVLPAKFDAIKIAVAALKYIDDNNKTTMTETDAYRFNIYNNDNRHKYRLHQTIEDNMWDF